MEMIELKSLIQSHPASKCSYTHTPQKGVFSYPLAFPDREELRGSVTVTEVRRGEGCREGLGWPLWDVFRGPPALAVSLGTPALPPG